MSNEEQKFATQKLILAFSFFFYEIEERNPNFFTNYCNYCKDLTKYYVNNKFSENNKNNDFVLKLQNCFETKITRKQNAFEPYELLNKQIDWNDISLQEYFEKLIIY
jgi:nucleosome binding factor SPN SPT16 subunit